MRKTLITLLFFTLLTVSYSTLLAQFQAEDINGEWKASAGYVIRIEGGTATVSSVPSNFPQGVIGGLLYTSISYTDNGTWKAQSHNFEQVSKKWVSRGPATITLKSDKNSFIVEGGDEQRH
jgi:hypothetical protein